MTSTTSTPEMLVVGRITTVFGIRGWLKVFSYTENVESIFDYQPWWIDLPGGLKQLVADDFKRHGDGLVVHLQGVDDRDVARTWCQHNILVAKNLLPSLTNAEHYWHQLVGLQVFCQDQGTESRLGVVDSLLETGANDVLVVIGDTDSIDREERMIPYSKEFVVNVAVSEGRIDVVWDPHF